MATIPSNPLFMTDVDLLIGADDFAAAVSSVVFTPSASIVTKKGLKKGSVFSRTTDPTWTCDVTFAQNFDDDKSLSMYLLLNQGKSVAATFRPKSGKRAITATIQITPGAIGGAIDTFADATVSFGVEGTPTVGAIVA